MCYHWFVEIKMQAWTFHAIELFDPLFLLQNPLAATIPPHQPGSAVTTFATVKTRANKTKRCVPLECFAQMSGASVSHAQLGLQLDLLKLSLC